MHPQVQPSNNQAAAEFTLFLKLPADTSQDLVGYLESARMCEESDAEISKCLEDIVLSPEDWRALGLPEEKSPKLLINRDLDILSYDALDEKTHVKKDFGAPIIYPRLIKNLQAAPCAFVDLIEDGPPGSFEFWSPDQFMLDVVTFAHFPFQKLDKFILQDVNCKGTHQLDSPENRDGWKYNLTVMFHNEKARTPNCDFMVPEVIVRPGVKGQTFCDECQPDVRRRRRQR
ncbi:hypothetical protein OCU04_010625 [Sclerotinia nivalis]|uniref:Uncharacterized protein n=1 Tax=Sclerotinia nivalis TaxID=352851 RepID=A0A9X0DGV4_9HELO|nr:hypothetical protein OCU04_010625 [Sclerotinia nivalis]